MRLVFKAETSGAFEERVVDFFSHNSNPTDGEIHSFASSIGLEPHELEQEIYKMLSTFLGGGKSYKKKLKPQDVDQKQLRMGIKVEMEHVKDTTYSKKIAQKIAMDHLEEFPDYYSRLKEMEKK